MNEVVRALPTTEDEAVAWIAKALDEVDFAKEAESYRLAKQFELNLAPIKSVWDQERREAKVRLAADRAKLTDLSARLAKVKPPSFFVPSTQPRVEESKKHTPEPVIGAAPSTPSIRRKLSIWEPKIESEPVGAAPASAPSRALVVAQEVLPAVPTDPAIAAMNEHHAIIDNVGGKAVIACWEPSPLDPSKLMVIFQDKSSQQEDVGRLSHWPHVSADWRALVGASATTTVSWRNLPSRWARANQ
jgi:hypothetical protein